MAHILVQGRGKIAFGKARLFFTPGQSHYKPGYLQPRAGHVYLAECDTRSRLRYGITLSDPPWYNGDEDGPEKALRKAFSYLIEEFGVDKSRIERLKTQLLFES